MQPPQLKLFKTSRLFLRKITINDHENIYKGLSHPEVIKFYGVSYSSFEETKEQMIWYENLEKSGAGLWWSIRLKNDNSFCGAIGYNDYNPIDHKAEVGFWLLPDFWGKGIIIESAETVLKHLFRETHLHRIEAFVEDGNKNSEKVLKKLGFRYEGTMKECERKNNRYIDIHLFALLNK